MMQTVLKLGINDDEEKKKVMVTVCWLSGVDSISMDMKDKKLTVIGYIDPVTIVIELRKLCHTEIVSVGPAKEPEKPKPPLHFRSFSPPSLPSLDSDSSPPPSPPPPDSNCSTPPSPPPPLHFDSSPPPPWPLHHFHYVSVGPAKESEKKEEEKLCELVKAYHAFFSSFSSSSCAAAEAIASAAGAMKPPAATTPKPVPAPAPPPVPAPTKKERQIEEAKTVETKNDDVSDLVKSYIAQNPHSTK